MEKHFLSRTGKQPVFRERQLIGTNREYEINYWCQRLGCNRDELKEVVNIVGGRAGDVSHFLSRRPDPEIRFRKGGFLDFFGNE